MKKYAGLDFSQAVAEFSDDITKICIFKLRNIEDAKECFHNIFLKLHLSNATFASKEQLRAWLIRVACNECTDLNRSYWKKKVSLEPSPYDYSQFTDDFECIEMIETIRSLPEKYREIIYLHYYCDYSTAEISKILRLSVNTVKSRLQRAREKLSTELKK